MKFGFSRIFLQKTALPDMILLIIKIFYFKLVFLLYFSQHAKAFDIFYKNYQVFLTKLKNHLLVH